MLDFQKELETLSHLFSVSGTEDAAQRYFSEAAKPRADKVHVDRLGNVLAEKRSSNPDAPTLLIDAHMDEVGYFVSEHCGKGFVKIARVGGTDPALLPASELLIYGKQTVRAVVAAKPPHLIKESEREKKQMIDSLFVDTLLSEKEAKELLPVGTPAGFADGICVLKNGRVASRGLDNRVSGLCLLRLLELLSPEAMNYHVLCLWSMEEETGGALAASAAFGASPDLSICVDVSFAAFEGAEDKLLKLGGGAGLSFSDTLSRTLTRDMLSATKKEGIALQLLAEPGETGTNAHEIQVTGKGIPSALVSIPLSYMHSPNEVVCLSDLEATAHTLCAFVKHGTFYAKEETLVG